VDKTVTTAPATQTASDPNWLALVECATREVFEIMLGCEVQLANSSEHDFIGGFTAIVGIAGALCGVVTVRCSTITAAHIAQKMLGDTSAEGQAVDALGEMCNMIAGNFKNKLAGTDEKCMLSVPSVISGGAYRFHSLVHGKPLETVVILDGAEVVVRLQLKI
jgi:chemotaxis protein CheX